MVNVHESSSDPLPGGVILRTLVTHVDARGALTEIFREEWQSGMQPVQWNVVHSLPGAVRGMHVHIHHKDYLVVPRGRMLLGLKDLRNKSSTYGMASLVTLDEKNMQACVIPPGVAHCFYFPVPSTLMYSLSEYWDTSDDLGCRWNDPEIGIQWPVESPLLSERDAHASSLRELMKKLEGVEFPQ